MFVEESQWVKNSLATLNLSKGARVADLGSSDLFMRTRAQPHIYENIYKPLLDKGILITSVDSKPELGVDVVADVAKREQSLSDVVHERFDVALCCNMLEHVTDRDIVIRNILSIIRQDGYLLITVPHRYFYHEDPIDTMYRPGPQEIIELVGRHCQCTSVTSEIISISERHYYTMPVYPNVLWHNIPFIAYRKMWRWFVKPFRWKVSGVLLQVHSSQQ